MCYLKCLKFSFLKILTLLAQFSKDLGPKRFHLPFRFEYKKLLGHSVPCFSYLLRKVEFWGKSFPHHELIDICVELHTLQGGFVSPLKCLGEVS